MEPRKVGRIAPVSNLAPIRRIPKPATEAGSVDDDIARLVEACRAMDRRDELIRSLHERGVSVKRLTEITGLSHQRAYQVLNRTNGHEPRAVEDSNGRAATST